MHSSQKNFLNYYFLKFLIKYLKISLQHKNLKTLHGFAVKISVYFSKSDQASQLYLELIIDHAKNFSAFPYADMKLKYRILF